MRQVVEETFKNQNYCIIISVQNTHKILEKMRRHRDTAHRQRIAYERFQRDQKQTEVIRKTIVPPKRRAQRFQHDTQKIFGAQVIGFIGGRCECGILQFGCQTLQQFYK